MSNLKTRKGANYRKGRGEARLRTWQLGRPMPHPLHKSATPRDCDNKTKIGANHYVIMLGPNREVGSNRCTNLLSRSLYKTLLVSSESTMTSSPSRKKMRTRMLVTKYLGYMLRCVTSTFESLWIAKYHSNRTKSKFRKSGDLALWRKFYQYPLTLILAQRSMGTSKWHRLTRPATIT